MAATSKSFVAKASAASEDPVARKLKVAWSWSLFLFYGVAHYNKKTGEFSEGLTFGDVHEAMDLIFQVLNHYNRLILGSTTAGSVTMPPWEAVFRVAWIPDEDAYRHVAQTQQETDDARM